MEFECRDPRAKVRAPRLLWLVDTFQLIPSMVDSLLKKHGLTRAMFETHEYIHMSVAMEMMRDIHDRIGQAKLRQLGTKAIEAAMFPPQFDTVERALLALDTIYSLNHLGDVGHYHATKLPDGAIEVRCATPYPRAFERGLVEGIARNASLTGGRVYVVDYDETPGEGDETCVCTVRERSSHRSPRLFV